MPLKTPFVPSWVRQKPDPRDFHFNAPRRLLASLPATVDLSAHMGPQLDQGQLGMN